MEHQNNNWKGSGIIDEKGVKVQDNVYSQEINQRSDTMRKAGDDISVIYKEIESMGKFIGFESYMCGQEWMVKMDKGSL